MMPKEYMWLVSTFKPTELGNVESDILNDFIHSSSNSTYGIYGIYPKAMAYKNIHKRVQRLAQLKLIEPVQGHFKRGAKYYKISPYGLITYLGGVITESSDYLYYNKDNIVIQYLLLEFLNEETIDSFRTLKEFPTADIGEYLHDCCSSTILVCKRFWAKIKQFNLEDILPNDTTIQKYMSYLDGRHVDKHILDEIEEYKKRLRTRLGNTRYSEKLLGTYNQPYFLKRLPVNRNKNSVYENPPFPLLDMYFNIVLELEITLEIKAKILAFNLVSQLGEIVVGDTVMPRKPIESQEELEEGLLESGRDYSLYNILNDKKFIQLVRSVKRDFEYGYKQFQYYHYDNVTSRY